MFGLSWSEILIIGVVALVFIGPNDLPKAMKTAARWMSAGRKLAREFQGHVDDLVREAELDELRDQARKLAMQPLSSHLEALVDPDKEIAKALAPPDNLHEFLTGSSAVAPVDEPAALPPLVIASEPTASASLAIGEAPTPEPKPAAKPKRKPAAKTIEATPSEKPKPKPKRKPATTA